MGLNRIGDFAMCGRFVVFFMQSLIQVVNLLP